MYTDEYSDELENDNENFVETGEQIKPQNGFNIKLVIVIILLIIVGVLITFILKGNSSSKDYVLTIRPDIITIPLGKSQNIAYDVRKDGVIVPNANVKLVIENEDIASADNTVITGVSYGKTKLIAMYTSDNGKTYQSSKEITIADGDPNVRATGVTFPDGDLSMPLNGTYDIALTVLPPNGYIDSRVITSSNTNVVKVNNKGNLTAVGEGTAIVSIDVNNGLFKKDINVVVSKENTVSTVTSNPVVITLSGSVKALSVGDSATLKYTITPANANTSSLKWKSSNTNVLTVDSNGKVKAIKEGMATITVTTPNNVSDSVNIQVNEKANQITKIDFSMSNFAFLVGESEVIKPTITPSNATNKLTYTSSDPSIIKVTPSSDTKSVTLNALAPGSVVLTIKADNGVEKKINITAIG